MIPCPARSASPFLRRPSASGLRAAAALFLAALAALPAPAAESGVVAFDQALRDLASDHAALCFAAHPDDVDFEILALLRHRFGVRTIIACAVDPDREAPGLEEMLGVRRGGLAAAADHIGAETLTLGMPYPGFVRDEAAALESWDRAALLSRVVRTIREVRPALILAGRREGEYGEDGQHRLLASVLLEAFDAAADTAAFPEAGPAFAVAKLMEPCRLEEAEARPDTGKADLVRGGTYAEAGAAAWRLCLHPDVRPLPEPAPGPRLLPYRALKSRVPPGELLSGLTIPRPEWLSAEEWGGRAAIAAELVRLALAPAGDRPEESRLGRAASLALGLTFATSMAPDPVVAGEPGTLRVRLRNGGFGPVRLTSLTVSPGEGVTVAPLPALPPQLSPGEVWAAEAAVALAPPPEGALTVRRLALALSFGPAEEGVLFRLAAGHEVTEEPAVLAAFRRPGLLFRPAVGRGTVFVEVVNRGAEEFRAPALVSLAGTDRLAITAPPEVVVPPRSTSVLPIALEGREGLAPGSYGISLAAGGVGARSTLRVFDAEVPAELSLAAVEGAEDPVCRALEAMGVRPALLRDEDLLTGDLAPFDAIVLGPRAVYRRPVLRQVWPRLLRFVEAGGVLVTAACRPEDWSPAFSPRPFSLDGERVTRPDAPLTFPDPEHRIVRFPNALSPDDFAGFRLDRGAFFPQITDADAFEVPVLTGEPGGEPRPAVVLTGHGKGAFVYTALSWPRHLDDLNPGALRLLGNLVSYLWRR